MRIVFPCLGVGLAMALAAPAAQAQYFAQAQCFVPYIPKAPDACRPGSYGPNCNGLYYGPNYCVYPPFPPFQGMLPPPPCGSGLPGLPGMTGPTFPTHPFARGPRDYFMVYDP